MINVHIGLFILIIFLSIGAGYSRGHMDGFNKGMKIAQKILKGEK